MTNFINPPPSFCVDVINVWSLNVVAGNRKTRLAKVLRWIVHSRKFMDITSSVLLRHHKCAYQGVRDVSFSENFANVLNEWFPYYIIKNPVDTWRRFNVDTTSYRRLNDVVCLLGRANRWVGNDEWVFFNAYACFLEEEVHQVQVLHT